MSYGLIVNNFRAFGALALMIYILLRFLKAVSESEAIDSPLTSILSTGYLPNAVLLFPWLVLLAADWFLVESVMSEIVLCAFFYPSAEVRYHNELYGACCKVKSGTILIALLVGVSSLVVNLHFPTTMFFLAWPYTYVYGLLIFFSCILDWLTGFVSEAYL